MGKYQGAQLLNHMVNMFSFRRKSKMIFQSGGIILHPTSNAWDLWFHIVSSIYCCQCSRFWPFLYVCSDISLLLQFAFPQCIWCEASFHVPICHLSIFLGEVSLAHILIKLFSFLLLNCRSSLYIVDGNPLSDIWVADIVFYSEGCLFTLLIESFDYTEGFSFNVIQFFYFYFCCLCF